MGRFRIGKNVTTGEETLVPYTAAEEAAADAAASAPSPPQPRDIFAELDNLRARNKALEAELAEKSGLDIAAVDARTKAEKTDTKVD